MKTKKGSLFFLAIGTILLAALDQLTKWAAITYLKGNLAFPIIKGVFELSYLENRGSAFGLMQGKRYFFLAMTAVVLIIIPYIYSKMPLSPRFRLLRLDAVFFLAGALGNAIDRVIRGYVVDFFYFSLIDFPVFNVADIYVSVSAFALFLLMFFYYKEEDLNQIELTRRKSE